LEINTGGCEGGSITVSRGKLFIGVKQSLTDTMAKLGVRVDDDTVEQLERRVEEAGITKSVVLRRGIDNFLNNPTLDAKISALAKGVDSMRDDLSETLGLMENLAERQDKLSDTHEAIFDVLEDHEERLSKLTSLLKVYVEKGVIND